LQRSVDLSLLASRNIGANRFCHAFDGLGCDLQTRQQFHVLATLIERCLLPYQSLHASYAG
jgi:hypothetical protein